MFYCLIVAIDLRQNSAQVEPTLIKIFIDIYGLLIHLDRTLTMLQVVRPQVADHIIRASIFDGQLLKVEPPVLVSVILHHLLSQCFVSDSLSVVVLRI